ncbi:hypothetical protein ACFS4T_34200 [Pseudomonas lini]
MRAVQQVGGGVVGEGFALAVQAVLAGDDAAIGIIGFVGGIMFMSLTLFFYKFSASEFQIIFNISMDYFYILVDSNFVNNSA